MPRARFVDPEITKDEEFAGTPRDARLMFVYALTHADDAGNIPRSAAYFKAHFFPYDYDLQTEEIDRFIELFIEGTWYLPYTFNGKRYIHIRNFAKYQRPEHPCAPKHPLAPGQKYRYSFKKDGKWAWAETTENEWNERLKIKGLPGRLPVDSPETTENLHPNLPDKGGREGVRPNPLPPPPPPVPPATAPGDRLDAAPSARPVQPADGTGECRATTEELAAQEALIAARRAAGIPEHGNAPGNPDDQVRVDYANPDHLAMVDELDHAGIDTTPLRTLGALRRALAQNRAAQAQAT